MMAMASGVKRININSKQRCIMGAAVHWVGEKKQIKTNHRMPCTTVTRLCMHGGRRAGQTRGAGVGTGLPPPAAGHQLPARAGPVPLAAPLAWPRCPGPAAPTPTAPGSGQRGSAPSAGLPSPGRTAAGFAQRPARAAPASLGTGRWLRVASPQPDRLQLSVYKHGLTGTEIQVYLSVKLDRYTSTHTQTYNKLFIHICTHTHTYAHIYVHIDTLYLSRQNQ